MFAFFPHRTMLIWFISSALVTFGPPLGQFLMGFVGQRVGWEWIYWTFAITSAVQFIFYEIFSPEARYVKRPVSTTKSRWIQQYLFRTH